ncbi:MAG: serine/threonine protein kinase [Planctomycetes bacterium]|nr:serine/threonine protein kinase [Planctomycetota bacterium]
MAENNNASQSQSGGASIPGYQIQGKLGSGGMGIVFKALDIKNNRTVALKLLYPKTVQNKTFLDRFAREAKLLMKFDHPNIVKGYQVANYKGLYFLAMEYIEGKSAQQLLDEKGPFKEDFATYTILQAAKALEYMQKEGIIHRDVKPDNLLITPDNKVKLCDLGFAQPIGCATTETSTDTTCGTPQYMSPEQAKGKADIDIRSDIYSLGATFYHLVIGKTPFQGTDNMEIMAKQVLDSLQSDEVKNRRLSPLTLYFIEKMMAKEKEIRYQNPTEVIEDIEAQTAGFKSLFYEKPATPTQPKTTETEPKQPTRMSRLEEIRKKYGKK